eukprot:TRINITY_DN64532_c0_g1_i1.p1 TRINITY_DN64532_c0_g1~~TRINITY_DN64532_c0_g1_i1.p1  ORF type:complete len:152 (-),score=51.84 TRINITY_DN64532_c0_g1_i1:300-755(-)
MIRRPPRSTLSSSSAASDVYKRQVSTQSTGTCTSWSMPSQHVYKLLKRTSYDMLGDATECHGEEIDAADGYVHLSHASELLETVRRYYAGQEDAICLKIRIDLMANKELLRWEESSDERTDMFPHLYGSIPMNAVVSKLTLPEITGEWLED